MGSTLAPLIANIFIGCLERSVISKLIKSGDVVSWTRFADDNLAIIKLGSHDKILFEINRWDQHIFYTSEKLLNNQLNFLSCTLFVRDSKIEFKTYRKSGLSSITSNYQKSVMAKSYLKSAIFTALHHSLYSSSTQELFLEDLPNIKEIFLRNGYPEKIINEKFSIFLCSPEKPPQPEISMTFCSNYTSPKIEYYLRTLVNRIKTFISTFHVRYAYKSMKVKLIFIKDSKPACTKL